MASLLRSRLNLSARRVPSLQASANSVRCVQRRLASDQASGSTNIPVYLPALGATSLALVVYLVYDAWTYDTTSVFHPSAKPKRITPAPTPAPAPAAPAEDKSEGSK